MNDVSPWLDFWSVVLIVGLGSYYLIVLAVIPLGARDIRRLLVTLNAARSLQPHDDDSIATHGRRDDVAKQRH